MTGIEEHRIMKERRFLVFVILLVGGIGALGILSWTLGSSEDYVPHGFAASSRSLNSILGAVLTSIALVISLTSNLYTPRLVQLFLTHPVILVGLTGMVAAHMFMATAMFFPPSHPFHTPLMALTTALSYTAYAGILPFLYIVSQFLRPSYFLPRLTRKAEGLIRNIETSKHLGSDNQALHSHINVITNISFTGMKRGDRQLALITILCLHDILLAIISLDRLKSKRWRSYKPFFTASLAKEGREYLRNAEIWPEAYILGQMLQIMNQSDARHNELLSTTAERLIQSITLALKSHSEGVVELHVLAFNSLMRLALDDKDLSKFQVLSYHYRVLIETASEYPKWMNEISRHLLHYGKMAAKSDLAFALDTVIYDLGDIVLSLAAKDEYTALTFLHIYAGAAWLRATHDGGPEANSAWRSMIRVYWEARACEYVLLAETLRAEFLENSQHRRMLKKILEDNRPLHWEYNDRLLRFAFLSPEAEKQATSFSNESF